jgi:hypothetical protein
MEGGFAPRTISAFCTCHCDSQLYHHSDISVAAECLQLISLVVLWQTAGCCCLLALKMSLFVPTATTQIDTSWLMLHLRKALTRLKVQGDQKSLCTWLLQYRKLQVTFSVSPASLQTFIGMPSCLAADRQGQGDTWLKLTPSVIRNSNYVMVCDWNCIKFFCMFFVL